MIPSVTTFDPINTQASEVAINIPVTQSVELVPLFKKLQEQSELICALQTDKRQLNQEMRGLLEGIATRPQTREEELAACVVHQKLLQAEFEKNTATRKRDYLLVAGVSATSASIITGIAVAAGLGAIHCVLL